MDRKVHFKAANHLGSRGRRRKLSAKKSLTLVLAWLQTIAPRQFLCLMHGVASTTYNKNLILGRILLNKIILWHPKLMLAWPHSQE